MQGQVTIADLAGRLGISKASVSYALNGQPGVSPQTRERVRTLAEELGWYPSSSARALARAKTGVIGLVLARDPEVLGTEPYFLEVISGIEQVLIEADTSLLLRMVGSVPGRDLTVYERWAGERRVDGVILVDQQQDDPRYRLVLGLGLPAVLHGGPVPGVPLPTVVGDEPGDAARVVDHLRALGHRHIAHLAGPASFAHERRRPALARAHGASVGLRVDVHHGDYTLEGARELTRMLLRAADRPTALVFSNDLMAIGGLDAAAELGIGVPEQLSVVSWDDSMLCRVARPTVTALNRFPRAFGAASARLLLEVIAGKNPSDVVVGPSTLAVRGTSGRVPS